MDAGKARDIVTAKMTTGQIAKARQTGKTSLVRRLFPAHSYVATYGAGSAQPVARGQAAGFRALPACRRPALRAAQLLNRADMARDVGISPSTAGQWLSALERSGILSLLEPWFSNRTKSLVRSPKLHFQDSGLCAFLMGMNSVADLHDVCGPKAKGGGRDNGTEYYQPHAPECYPTLDPRWGNSIVIYSAELSCMCFAGCDYAPRNRKELEAYDPEGCAMIRELWGIEQ